MDTVGIFESKFLWRDIRMDMNKAFMCNIYKVSSKPDIEMIMQWLFGYFLLYKLITAGQTNVHLHTQIWYYAKETVLVI